MGNGLHFCKADLHVHTPASNCFLEKDVTPEEIVDAALEAGLAAIAVTDHNTGAWVDLVKAAAEPTPLVVFPGVEITVQPGVHVIALFPTDRTTAHVIDLLAELGLKADHRGSPEALVTEHSVHKVITIIQDNRALPVLAHIDAIRGAWTALGGQTRLQLWQEAPFAAVEVVGDGLPEEIGENGYERRPACYWASDNPHPQEPTKHSHLGIGTRYACFKVDPPITWEGLRLCFDDPDQRIRRELPVVAHPVVERVRVNGGFLSGLEVALNPYLNCLIGGRGTGKSAMLELVRCTLDLDPKTEENERQARSLLEHVFPKGALARIDFTVGDVRYRVERVSGEEPRVLRGNGAAVASDEWQQIDVAPVDLLPMQVYGQKEIYQISLDPEFQLRLLDNYVDEALAPLKEEEEALLRRLGGNADEILRLEEEVEAAQDALARLPVIREELLRMEDLGFVERVKEKGFYDREKRLLDGAEAAVGELLAALNAFPADHRLAVTSLEDGTLEDLPHRPLLAAQRQLLEALNALLTADIASLAAAIETKWAEGAGQRAAWRATYDEQERAYRQILDELAEGGEIAPNRYVQLQEREADLEERERQVAEREKEIAAALEVRSGLLAALRRVRREQYEVRCRKAAELTKALGKKVRITLCPAGHREPYKEYLAELFAGNHVRYTARDALAGAEAEEPEREAQMPVPMQVGGERRYLIPKIPRYLDPIDLAEALRVEQTRDDEEPSLLESRFGVDSDAMRRNMCGVSREQLFALELFAVPDLPVIELQVGSGKLGYRPLDRLSVGQKCTALLSIILLESHAPLLIDQPEDDLDNQFIFDQIVETLRSKKEQRQFLIATHNANIPVSGDAELILVLEADESHAEIADGGSIDRQSIKDFVTRILEGGSRAFRIRKEKYGKMVEE
ncbi:MAG: TrlF family AAA-like ATPase [Anaerolineales bacterium]